MRKKIMMILKGEKEWIDIYHFLLGNYRYWAYYHHPNLLRPHIREQINYRIHWMKQECYELGYCVQCGCETTALQMANKPCDKPCYPEMMNSAVWHVFKKGATFTDQNGSWQKKGSDLVFNPKHTNTLVCSNKQ
jgi:hypothetical protein